MNSQPLVSAVIPFLNAEKFLEEAIESVFAQTYANWELLLVDDGSTDASTEIALQYARQYPGKVRYLEHDGHENRGRSASRNLGIRYSKGAYIAFLDADDVWLPHKLGQQVSILELQPEAAMVFGPAQVWYSWTGNSEDIGRDVVTEVGSQPNALIEPSTMLIRCIQDKPFTPLPSIMVRRKIAERIGGFEEVFQGMYEDKAFLVKLCLKASVFEARECWCKYRIHPDSCVSMSMKAGTWDSARIFFLNWVERYLSKQRVKNSSEVWKALQKELWPYRHPILFRRLSRSAQQLVKQLKWQLHTTWMVIAKLKRLVLRRSIGSIIAHPNPIVIQEWDRFPVGVTTLSWTSERTTEVEVHVGTSDGPLFSSSGPSGSETTGRWVNDGTVFYLQDVSGGLPLALAHTLDIVRVKVTSAQEHTTKLPTRIFKQIVRSASPVHVLYRSVREESRDTEKLNNKVIQGLWIGNTLSVMEQLSIVSFIKHGHEYHLYVYEDVKGIPKGTILKDANEIVSRREIFRDKAFRAYTEFADVFRYRLLLEKGGYWVDTDVICFRPLDFESEYVFAQERGYDGSRRINGNVIKVPVASEVMQVCYEMSLRRAHDNHHSWGELGPSLLTRAVERFDLHRYVMSYKTFNPIDWWNWPDIISDRLSARMKMRVLREAYAVHLWHELWRRAGVDKSYTYHPKCLYEQLKKLYLGS